MKEGVIIWPNDHFLDPDPPRDVWVPRLCPVCGSQLYESTDSYRIITLCSGDNCHYHEMEGVIE